MIFNFFVPNSNMSARHLRTLTPSLPKLVKCMDGSVNSIFSSPITSTFNAMSFDESSFTCHCEKEDKKA